MAIDSLTHPNATAHYDEETRIAYITYSGFLDGSASTAAYEWLATVNETVGIPYGEVFDFRAVTEFMPDNLLEARKKSRRRNLRSEIHNLPVAMVVKDYYQEEILRGPMQNVPENNRKTIVKTMEEAIEFLHNWHKQHS
jgi:hypothetical protein